VEKKEKGQKKEKGKKLEKNEFGFVVGSRKDRYCQLMKEGGHSKKEILRIVKKEFGTASENAFQFFLRDLRLKRIKVERATTLKIIK